MLSIDIIFVDLEKDNYCKVFLLIIEKDVD